MKHRKQGLDLIQEAIDQAYDLGAFDTEWSRRLQKLEGELPRLLATGCLLCGAPKLKARGLCNACYLQSRGERG